MKDIKDVCRTSFREQASQYLNKGRLREGVVKTTYSPEKLTPEQMDKELADYITKNGFGEYVEILKAAGKWGLMKVDLSDEDLRKIKAEGGSFIYDSTWWSNNREDPNRYMEVYIYPGSTMPYWLSKRAVLKFDLSSSYRGWGYNPETDADRKYYNEFSMGNREYWTKTFKEIKAAHDRIVNDIIPAYPFLAPRASGQGDFPEGTLGTIVIMDMGQRVIKNKIIIEIFRSKVGSAASIFKNLEAKSSNAFYKNNKGFVCEIPLDKIDYYMKRIKPFLEAVVEAQSANKEYEKFDRSKENYSITSDSDKGTTTVRIKMVYSKEALTRMCDCSRTYDDATGDLVCTYPWTDFPIETFKEEMSDLIKFLDNPHNVLVRDIPEYKELWGVTWGNGLSDEQAKKVHYYFVIIQDGYNRWTAKINEGQASKITRKDPDVIFINPFWFLKQSKVVQLSLLKRAFRDLEVPEDLYGMFGTIITACKKTIQSAIDNRVVRHYEKLLKRKMIESSVASKRNSVLFHIIKRDDGMYYTNDGWSEDINQAEAFENYEDAEDILSELIYEEVDDSNRDSNPEEYLAAVEEMQDRFSIKGVKAESFYEKKSALKRLKDAVALREASKKFVIRDEDSFFSEEDDAFISNIENATKYNSLKDARKAIKDFFEGRAELFGFGRSWVTGAMNEVIFEPYADSEKIIESKEKDLIVDFEIPVSDKGRIKANDAKKLLKYLAANKLLRLSRTYFITDSAGFTTCWDLEEGTFSGYSFNCEVTETPEGEECDVYHELTFEKENGKLTNFEWECHRV